MTPALAHFHTVCAVVVNTAPPSDEALSVPTGFIRPPLVSRLAIAPTPEGPAGSC